MKYIIPEEFAETNAEKEQIKNMLKRTGDETIFQEDLDGCNMDNKMAGIDNYRPVALMQ